MFVLNSNITIGLFKKVKPVEVKINKSLYEYVDRAVIKLPITARIIRAGQVITESVETAKQFTEGDKVSIELGYNGTLKPEFEGFINRINFTDPLEIEAEGYSYQLRNKTYQRTFVRTELIDVLRYLVQGTDIVLDEEHIPSFILDKLVLQQHSGTEVLELIKKISHNTIQAYFRGNILFAGLVLTDVITRKNTTPDVKYRLGWNVVKDDNMKLRQAKNQNVTVRFLGLEKTGGTQMAEAESEFFTVGKAKNKTVKIVGEAGSDGETKVIKTHVVTDKETLGKMAKEMLSTLSYSGYEGKITAFLQPYCLPGYRAAIEDLKYQERSGTYLIVSIEVTYGVRGARRIVQIGIKL
ncbi:hypothetical protein SAMN05428988_1308 [Chitinophaga sp. YR573]|uniref:hypothetical protein n=1 Tax=Chitinophaga sp. YR573 TaxID=1881040 RepID=UPI0008C1CA8D|nr:hypothetical protein [Chitinophaga sp. YR573]SEW01881.1 hypothetical protein SAMN05428988_1308 [Chitinophaga sp. YR573]